MNTTRILRTAAGYAWRLPLCSLAYVVGVGGGGALVTALGMPLPTLPEQANERMTGLGLILASLALTLGLASLARRIRGTFAVRWLALALLCYVCLGVNMPIEAAIFTRMGGMATMPVLFILPCLLFAATLALLFKPADRGDSFLGAARRFFEGRSAGQWTCRIVAAVCAFPLVYWTFGLMIAPIVRPYYEQGQFGLALPSAATIVLVQFLRSVLFLAATMPILIAGSAPRRHLILALGLAFYVLVGLYGMIQTYWLAPTLLVMHNLEIFTDSMVYALVLALLLVHGREARADELLARFLLCSEQATVAE